MDSNNEEVSAETKNAHEESSVTMLDVLEQEQIMEEEYAAVLGGSDEKCCTYAEGPVKRQALYSCLTCTPEVRNDLSKAAGVCLACSYKCHENHELVELYTKRNFRCDCPTERLGRCVLNTVEQPRPKNDQNLYNDNFKGIYCTCKRPYPDPERTSEELMLQCAVCEDWFHLQHLDVPPTAAKLVDACSEIICNICMEQHTFLRDYTGLALKALEDADESSANITVSGDVSICESERNLGSNLDTSSGDVLVKTEEGNATEKTVTNGEDNKINTTSIDEEPAAKRQKLEGSVEANEVAEKSPDCKRPKGKIDYEKGATFWGNDWRSVLCQCPVCLMMYKNENIEYLLDAEDPAKTYEERGIKRAASVPSTYEQGISALASIGRTQQIDAITEYNRMKDKLKEYLQSFAVSKKVVTEEDINRFFAEMRKEKNTNVGQPYFCR